MTEIRHIVFHIGKVLIHYDPHLPFRRLIRTTTHGAGFRERMHRRLERR